MRFLLDQDSWLMRVISRLCDLAVLNIVFLLTCLPVFTIGAANAALYAAVFPMDTEKEGAMLKTYFRSFRENFWQGTLVFAILVLFAGATYYNMTAITDPGALLGRGALIVVFLVVMLLAMVWTWVFPLICRFRNSTANMLKNALLLAIGNLPRTLLAVVILVFPWALLFVNLYAFIRISFLWVALYFAASAYYISRLLKSTMDALE